MVLWFIKMETSMEDNGSQNKVGRGVFYLWVFQSRNIKVYTLLSLIFELSFFNFTFNV